MPRMERGKDKMKSDIRIILVCLNCDEELEACDKCNDLFLGHEKLECKKIKGKYYHYCCDKHLTEER